MYKYGGKWAWQRPHYSKYWEKDECSFEITVFYCYTQENFPICDVLTHKETTMSFPFHQIYGYKDQKEVKFEVFRNWAEVISLVTKMEKELNEPPTEDEITTELLKQKGYR